MSQSLINPNLLQEIEAALRHLSAHVIKNETNIDEICHLINKAELGGNLWTFIHCYASADEDDSLTLLSVIEGKEMILTIPVNRLTNGA